MVKKCAHCGEKFLATRESHIYCSKKCKASANYLRHREKYLAKEKIRRTKKREQLAAYRREYYKRNRERTIAKSKEYYHTHKW